MLGTLAKWLRICGIDTYYIKGHIKDKKLIEIAKKENRILLTRDKELIYNAKREQVKTVEINGKDLDEQIKTTLEYIKVKSDLILSRCTICNTVLENIPKKDVKGEVPDKVYENNEEFLICPKCEKIYWKGTHYENMLEKVNRYL